MGALMIPAAQAAEEPPGRGLVTAGIEQRGLEAGMVAPQAAKGWGFGEGISFGTKNFSGVVRDSSGTKYTCAADGAVYSLASALVNKGSMKAPQQVKSLKVAGNVPAGAKAKKGTVTSKNKLGQMAYIASLSGKPSNVEAAATEAAIARVGGVYSGSVWDQAAKGKYKAKNAKALKPAAKKSAELEKKAQKYAGPYTATVKLEIPKNAKKGEVRGIGLTAASGKNVPDLPFELKLSGPATFSDGSTALTSRTAASTQKVEITLTGEGKVTASLTVKGVAHDRPWISKGTSNKGRAQNLIVLGKKTDAKAKASAKATAPDFQAKIATEVKEKTVAKGDPLVDVLTVTSESGSWPYVKKTGDPITVYAKVDVYGPFTTPRAKMKDGSEFADSLIGTYDVELTGEGKVETDGSITAPEEGFYFFQARIDPKDQGKLAEKIKPFNSPFFEVSETSVVPWQVDISSAASAVEIEGGGVGVRDVITVSGMPENHGEFSGVKGWDGDRETIVHSLYFIPAGVEHSEGVTEEMEPLATVETPAQNGEYVIEESEFPIDHDLGVGTYQVVSEFAGDSRVASLRTSDTEESEQVVPEFGTVRTKAQLDGEQLRPGGDIWDTVILEGVFPEGAYTEVNLYAWDKGEKPSCEEPIWSAERIEHGKEAGEYQTGKFTVPAEGEAVYGFVERTFDQNGNTISSGECGAESETLEAIEETPPPPEQTPPPEESQPPVEQTAPAVTPPAPETPDVPAQTPQPSQPAELANTGFSSSALIPLALALVCAGSVAVLIMRRR